MGNSRLRRECSDAAPNSYAPRGGTAYLMILNAVRAQGGLIHGKLHQGREHCAIGSFFDVNPKMALAYQLIDEVAAVNDSAPTITPRQRKQMVMRWLRWKLASLGMPTVSRQARLADTEKVPAK